MKEGFELRFNSGDIVYWYDCHDRYTPIHYGMVDTQFSDAVCIDLLCPVETRTITAKGFDRVRLDLWEPDYKEHKLPVGWTYDTPLYTIGSTDNRDEVMTVLRNTDIRDKNAIKNMADKGYLVKKTLNMYKKVREFIDKGIYVLQVEYPSRTPTTISLDPRKVYDNYADADAERTEYEKERERIINLTDEEYSWELIEDKIGFYAHIRQLVPREIEKIREFFKGLKNIEDVEVRCFGECLEWKYFNKKKWYSVPV